MLVTINGITIQTAKGSISIDNAIEERSTCSFVVVDIEGVSHYSKGDIVRITNEDNIIVFEGEVENSVEKRIAGTGLYHSINCVDWHVLADRRIIAKAYKDMYAGDIVKDIINVYLDNEGVVFDDITTYYPDKIPVFTSNTNITSLNNTLGLKRGTETDFIPPNDSSIFTSKTAGVTGNLVSLFDNNPSTYATVSDEGGTLDDNFIINLTTEKTPYKYTFKALSGNNAPKDWKLEGWNGTVWIELDNRISSDKSTAVLTYYINNPIPVTQLRFTFGESLGNRGSYDDPVALTEIEIFEQAPTLFYEGTITSSAIDLSNVVVNKGNILSWDSVIPVGTNLTVETSLNNGQTWQVATSGKSIPTLFGAEELVGVSLLVRVSMSTYDLKLSPSLSNLKILFTDKAGTLQKGEIIDEAVFNYIPISEAINKLAEQTGYWWDISIGKVLRFAERNTNISPFKINTMSINKDSLTVENGNSGYRNQQYIIGGKDITDMQTESFVADGKIQTFVVGYKLAKVPTIYIDNVQVPTVGIKGLNEENYEWFWSKGDSSITQKQSATPLTAGQVLKVEYQGEFDIVVVSKDDDEIRERKVITGGTGLVEHVDEDSSVSSKSAGFTLASKKLSRFGKIGKKVKFSTWKHGLQVGQLVTIDFPVHNVNENQFLINSIGISYEGGVTTYDVEAVHNLAEGSWAKFFYELSIKGRTYVIRENIGDDQILTTLEVFNKTWLQTDNPNIYSVLFPTTTTMPTASTYPSFDSTDRVKFAVLFNENTEIARKAITKQTISADGKTITSTVSIIASEGVGVITHVGWFGGNSATSSNGSGILIDKQIYNKEKSNLEAIQIDKIDVKGW